MSEIRRKLGISLTDQLALLALGGIVTSIWIWLLLAYTDSVMLGTPYFTNLFEPDEQHLIVRLAAIVVVLIATLVIQMGFSHGLRAEQLLLQEQARVRQMYDRSPEAILSIDRDFGVHYANPQASETFAQTTTDVVGTVCHKSVFACDAPCEGCPAEQVFDTGDVAERTFADQVDGQPRYFEQVFFPVLDADGKVDAVVESSRDVTTVRLAQEALRRSHEELEDLVSLRTTDLVQANDALEAEMLERQRTADALADSENRYRALIESSPDMVLVHREGRIAFLNSTGATLMGFSSAAEALGLPVAILIEPNGSGYTPEELLGNVQAGKPSAPIHVKLRRASGELIDVELSVSPMTFERDDAVQCIVRDISERVRAQETIQRMAYYDPLTDLPNRALFRDRLASALAQARRRTETVAVVFVDLDDFKAINDTLGHGVGDGVLKAVSRQICGVLREEDTVARQGGDEFTIIARVASRDDAGTLAERILESISGAFEVEGHQLHVSASIGISTYPQDGERDVDLIRNADAAMYQAKDWGHNVYRLYSPEMSESAAGRLELEAAMRHALEHNEFEIYYQPQVDVRDGGFVGVEALLRWNHPTRGLLRPGEFIELAEQAGYIGEIGHWVLQSACDQAKLWLAEGLEFGRVAVNLSAREFVQRNIVENVALALETTGLEPGMLELEITETIEMYNVEQILAILHLLRDMGVRVAIDDFGTGYSSMNYLKRFPVQTLKIAQDFMRDVNVDSQSAAIASMLIELCHELDLDIVAEGVENQSQLEFLRERGCFVIQGYLFSRPVSAGELGDILRNGADAQWAAAALAESSTSAE